VLTEPRLFINEIFHSIQGESSFSGSPCVFLRLTGCNLRCRYCDTEYAFYEGEWMSVEQVFRQLLRYETALIEVTGGEPLLQPAVLPLISRLLDEGKRVLVETGGSIDIRPVDRRAVLIYDVKCPDSGMAGKNNWANLQHLRTHDEVKFVISSRADYEWSKQVVRDRISISPDRVLFSPAWLKLDAAELAEWILKDRLAVRLQVQLHKILWGEKRGV
jgi:7-carboxy-7-deazaguanine synthase